MKEIDELLEYMEEKDMTTLEQVWFLQDHLLKKKKPEDDPND